MLPLPVRLPRARGAGARRRGASLGVALGVFAFGWSEDASACRGRAYCFKADFGLGYMLMHHPPALEVTPDGGEGALGELAATGPMSLLSFAGGFGYGSDRGLYFPFVYFSVDLPFNEPYPEHATFGGAQYERRSHGTFHHTLDIAGLGVAWPATREWLFTGQARPGYARTGTVGGANLEGPVNDASANYDAFVIHVDLRLCRTRRITACFWLAPTPYEGTWLGTITAGLSGHM